MARRGPGRNSGGRSGRGTASGRRSSAGSRGGMLSGLALVAAALAGGSYLYLHTPAVPHEAVPAAPVGREAEPDQTGRAPAPITAAPYPAMTAPSHPEEPQAARKPQASPRSGTALSIEGSAATSPRAPFGTSEEVFEAGARLYAANCAGCHGRPGRNGRGPSAAQFWDHSNPAGLHAIAQPAGALFQATARGNLVQGMPSYGQRLTDTQIWDIALLLRSAHDDLPDPVLRLLRGGR